MKNGNAKDFISGLHYGDERFFIYDNKKYFIQGLRIDQRQMLELYVLEPPDNNFEWRAFSADHNYPVDQFEAAKIFNGKTFWDVENEIEWVDC